jgi:hypothetical protein
MVADKVIMSYGLGPRWRVPPRGRALQRETERVFILPEDTRALDSLALIGAFYRSWLRTVEPLV